jgi:hypothetical protein
MRASSAANDIVPHTICWPRHWNVWSQLGGVDAVQSEELIGDDNGVAVDEPGRAGG